MDKKHNNSKLVKQSRKIYSHFWKPFVLTQIWAIFLFILTAMAIFFLGYFLNLEFLFVPNLILYGFPLYRINGFGIILPSYIVFNAVQGSLTGLSQDIVMSGDYYTRFCNLFHYFRKYWKQYSLVGIIYYLTLIFATIGIFSILNYLPEENTPLFIIFFIIFSLIIILFDILWNSFCVLSFSVISQGHKFKDAILYAFNFEKKHKKDIFVLFLKIFFLIKICNLIIDLIWISIKWEQLNNPEMVYTILNSIDQIVDVILFFVYIPISHITMNLYFNKFSKSKNDKDTEFSSMNPNQKNI
ncbi:MAG: hypothetical protein ACTSWC_07365 [Promethearchaeota archaeon]